MRSFKLRTATLTALLIAVPIAGAYARGWAGSVGEPSSMIMDQAQGLDQSIADARQRNTITAAEAQSLHMQAVDISQAAELGYLEQTLRLDTGNGNYSN